MVKRECLFCGRSPQTREHVFPNWLTSFFETELPDVKFTTEVFSSKGAKIGKWETSGVNDTVKVVCKNCNSGWMSDLEAAVKPILLNMFRGVKPLSFDDTQLQLLARWAYKTAIIIDKYIPGGGANPCNSIPTFVYRHFFESGFIIPKSVRIWTIPMLDPQCGIWHRRCDVKFSMHSLDVQTGTELLQTSSHLTTFGILNAVFQVLGPFDSSSRIVVENPAHLLQLFPQSTEKAMWPIDTKSTLIWEDREHFSQRKDIFNF